MSNGKKCIRKRVVIDDQHFYLVVSEDSIDCVRPFENRPENIKERIVTDTICKEATILLKQLKGDRDD